MKKHFTLNHLSPVDFENFCFDLLRELDFKNLNWRKGTGKKTSPSDRGRDIEGEKIITDIAGRVTIEKWFIECKRNTKGLPPERIQGALAWASAERPDKLLIITSNFLSNPCKDHIDKYISNNAPYFKIIYWELPDIESIVFEKHELRSKYGLIDDSDFINIVHPLHLKYSLKPCLNTLKYLFSVLEGYDSSKRDEIFSGLGYFITKSFFRKPVTGNESLSELQMNEINYSSVKETMYSLNKYASEPFVVQSTIDIILEWLLFYGDKTKTDYFIKKHERFNIHLRNETVNENKPSRKHRLQKMIISNEKRIKELPNQTIHWYSLYNDFCENVVSKLLLEEYFTAVKKSTLKI